VGHTAQNTSGRNTSKGQVADQINSTGIYATVRHPLYVGNFFMWLGIAMLTQQFWFSVAFVFMYWVYYERIMFAEEQFLRKKFGQPYVDWASKTPAFIPAISQYRNPRLPFSWKKVFKKEKNGVVAVFLLIFLFRVLGQSLAAKTLVVPVDFWLYALAGSIVYYALMKIFKKSAFLRDEGR
jgi:protein-S-isoprenylcysteine O-methyltransferase Ste14